MILGAGLAYAVEQEKYAHIPFVILFPTAYAGYHMYSFFSFRVRFLKIVPMFD